MKARLLRFGTASALAAGAALILTACGGGGGYGGSPSTPTSPSNPGAAAATVTIRAGGVLDPLEVRVEVGQAVRFVNEDTQAHHPQSNPHLLHNDCDQANIAVLNPGQSATTRSFPQAKACGYHDHMNPDATRLHGTIRVGDASGPTGPVYVVHD
jgi:plastocyanin